MTLQIIAAASDLIHHILGYFILKPLGNQEGKVLKPGFASGIVDFFKRNRRVALVGQTIALCGLPSSGSTWQTT
jgi:hypothetical protein